MLMSGILILFLCATVFMVPWGVVYAADERVIALVGSFWVHVYCHTGKENPSYSFKILADLLENCDRICDAQGFSELVCAPAPKYYVAGVILLIGFVFCIILEILSFFRSVNKLVNSGQKWKMHRFICFLRYNFLVVLCLSFFWTVFTGTLWNLFSVKDGAPSWGFGMALIASLVLLLIRIHYSVYRNRLDNR